MPKSSSKNGKKGGQKTAKTAKKSTACTQADKNRDSRGRFVVGNTPKTSFRDRPEDRYDITKDETYNPKNSPRYHLRKIFAMPREEAKKRIMASEVLKDSSYAEYLALKQAERARKTSKDFCETVNQAEGLPTQPVELEVIEDDYDPLEELTLEQLRRLAGDGNPKEKSSK